MFRYAAAAALLMAASCNSWTQTSSGTDYLSTANGATLDDEFRTAASVEPLITFPARIGIARIENGLLTDIPEDEWDALASALEAPPGAGNEYVPVSLFVIDLAAPRRTLDEATQNREAARRAVIDKLRLGGARQHLDAVIVYETYGRAEKTANALAIADLTLIGAYIAPSRKTRAVGHAAALMFDVRNGYAYGGAAASVEDHTTTPLFNSGDRARDLLAATQTAAVKELAPKLSDMMKKLELELGKEQAEATARKKAVAG